MIATVDKVWTQLIALKQPRVVAHVVSGREGQYNQIRRVGERASSHCQQLLRRAVIAYAKIQDLNFAAGQGGTRSEPVFQHMPKGLLRWNLQCLGKRVAEDGDAVCIRRLCQRMFAIAHPGAIDADISTAFLPEPAGGIGAQHPAGLIFKSVKVGIREAGDAQSYFNDDQRKGDTRRNEEQSCGPGFDSDHELENGRKRANLLAIANLRLIARLQESRRLLTGDSFMISLYRRRQLSYEMMLPERLHIPHPE